MKGQGRGIEGKGRAAHESTSPKTHSHIAKPHVDANIHGVIPARDGPSLYVFFQGTPVPRRQVENTMGEPVAMVKPQPTQRKKVLKGYVSTPRAYPRAPPNPTTHTCAQAS
jgi:hypothetical protein